MKNLVYLFALSVILYSNQIAFGANIVYPKAQEVVINSPVTFFVGNENPKLNLNINSEPVEIHPSGGFYHVVKLNIGENIFKISNGKTAQVYKITRPEPNLKSSSKTPFIITDYDSPVVFATNSDNVPLRSEPYDGGTNRLQHLEKGIPLNVVGEHKDFYRVQLARDDYVWVGKSFLSKIENYNNSPAKIESFVFDETANVRTFTIKMNKKEPYILSEARSFLPKGADYKQLEPYNTGFDFTLYNVSGYPENKYEFHINRVSAPFGYKTYYKNSKELVIEIKRAPIADKTQPLKDLKIVVDAGHGGDELGAIGCLGDKEKDINLAIAQKLKQLLENSGAKVIMTRDSDIAVSLNDRVKISKDSDADVFVSIHNNAFPDSAAMSKRSGSGVYYFYPQSRKLAEDIQTSLVDELKMNDDKVHQESFAVVRNTDSIAVLVEVGYMINPEDNSKLVNPEFQEQTAKAILHGMEKYINDTQQR